MRPITSPEEYVVEAIRDWRYNLKEGRKEYLIKWLNYEESDNTWEPEENLDNCPAILDNFIDNLSGREARFYHSRQPEKLSGFQRKATFVEFVGVDTAHDSDQEDNPKYNKQKFYCLASFDDNKKPEEVTIDEFFKHCPDKALAMIEERLLLASSDLKGTSLLVQPTKKRKLNHQ